MGDSAFWGFYARYYTACGELDAASECLMKRVRGLQSGALGGDAEAYGRYAEACTALARARLAQGSARELSQARMLLRATVKQGAESHSQLAAFVELAATLAEVEARAAAASAAAVVP